LCDGAGSVECSAQPDGVGASAKRRAAQRRRARCDLAQWAHPPLPAHRTGPAGLGGGGLAGLALGLGRWCGQDLADLRQALHPAAIGQQPVVAYPHQPLGQNVHGTTNGHQWGQTRSITNHKPRLTCHLFSSPYTILLYFHCSLSLAQHFIRVCPIDVLFIKDRWCSPHRQPRACALLRPMRAGDCGYVRAYSSKQLR